MYASELDSKVKMRRLPESYTLINYCSLQVLNIHIQIHVIAYTDYMYNDRF